MAHFVSSSLRLLSSNNILRPNSARFSVKFIKNSAWGKYLAVGGAVTAGLVAAATPVLCSDLGLHVPHLPWSHDGLLSAYDHKALRRGYQVYKEVCVACHSMKYMTFRQLVDHVLTEDEAKEHASEQQYQDGPDDYGKMFMRPGRLTDPMPSPYPNVEAARVANNGAVPPDLTFIAKARHGKEDYIFHLLTGYYDAPPGREVADGQYYNPYFPGGGIGMAQALYDDQVEFEDGTPATCSQMAKDVASFLTWSSDRNHDQRKRIAFKGVILLALCALLTGIYKRKRWTTLKTRKIVYKNRPPPKVL